MILARRAHTTCDTPVYRRAEAYKSWASSERSRQGMPAHWLTVTACTATSVPIEAQRACQAGAFVAVFALGYRFMTLRHRSVMLRPAVVVS